MKQGEKKKLKVTVSPKKGKKTIKFTTGNKKVTVSKSGMITVKKAGTAKIMVTVKAGKTKKTTWVKVKVTPETEEKMNGTKIKLTIGNTVIPATLNNTGAAQEFIKKLPFKVSAAKGEFDYCGMGGNLKYDSHETQAGWKNGDIGYARGWFALFHSGEEQSASYTNEMIIGHIDDSYLEKVRSLPGSVKILVELDK